MAKGEKSLRIIGTKVNEKFCFKMNHTVSTKNKSNTRVNSRSINLVRSLIHFIYSKDSEVKTPKWRLLISLVVSHLHSSLGPLLFSLLITNLFSSFHCPPTRRLQALGVNRPIDSLTSLLAIALIVLQCECYTELIPQSPPVDALRWISMNDRSIRRSIGIFLFRKLF